MSHYMKGCRSINKRFDIDPFLDWEGHDWAFHTRTLNITALAITLKTSFFFLFQHAKIQD